MVDREDRVVMYLDPVKRPKRSNICILTVRCFWVEGVHPTLDPRSEVMDTHDVVVTEEILK